MAHLVLVGPMGSGKSVVGRALADRVGRPFVDNDDLLAEIAGGSTANELAAARGLPELHRLERAALSQALGRSTPSVIAAAASVVDDRSTVAALAPHGVVWLTAEPSTLAARVVGGEHRPLDDDDMAGTEALLRRRAGERAERYEAVADVTVVTDDLTPSGVVEAVLKRWPGGRPT